MNKMGSVYMSMASLMAGISHGKRLKVGCVLVTQNGVVLTGVNGLVKPLGNVLEYDAAPTDSNYHNLVTKPEVSHSEENALLKAAREGVATLGSTIYLTHSPCQHCAALLAGAGVTKVVYQHVHRNGEGLEVLAKCGIDSVKMVRGLDEWFEDDGNE